MTVLGIDGVGAKFGGAATVLGAVIEGGLRSTSLARMIVFCSPASSRRFCLPESARVKVVDCGAWTESPAGRFAWLSGGFEAAARKLGADALLGMNGGGVARRGGLERRTVVIQQALPFWRERTRYLGWRVEPRFRLIRWVMRQGCRRARLVAVQSEGMKETVCRDFAIEGEKVISLPPTDLGLPKPMDEEREWHAGASRRPLILLYVGNTEPYKNLGVMVKAGALLRSQGVPVELRGTWASDHALAAGGHVKALGYLTPEGLANEMRVADVLVMPSLVETVGLPLLEAMAVGLPVVAADRPYAREACGDAAEYFPPFDEVRLAETLAHLHSAPERLKRLSEEGLRQTRTRAGTDPYRELIERTVSACGKAPVGTHGKRRGRASKSGKRPRGSWKSSVRVAG